MINYFIVLVLLVACFYATENVSKSLVFEEFSEHQFKRPINFIYPNEKFAYVVEQEGKVWQIDIENGYKKILVLNIKKRLSHGNEQGLLSVVLDPDFVKNNYIYVYYTTSKNSILSRFTMRQKIDLNSEVILLTIKQPYANHNGGQLAFGKDGFLYIGVGDGGSAGDPLKVGQDLNRLLGKILRIDVRTQRKGENYTIPVDNPFVGKGRAEIYAYGFRNPWTFSFDKLTGRLLCADVGQNSKEEVNLVVKGGNYGWSIKEADLIYNSDIKSLTKLIDPIASYDRKQGISITGGFVYRGSTIKSLQGYYLYTDYVSGKLWAIRLNRNGSMRDKKQFKRENLRISRFAQDYKGELYICSFKKGRILKVVAVGDK